MPERWLDGSGVDDDGYPLDFEVVAYQLVNGVRIEGYPDRELQRDDTLTGVLVHFHPPDDEEGGRYFWVHNPMNESPRQWHRMIQVRANRYEIDFTPGGGGGGPLPPVEPPREPPGGEPEEPERPEKPGPIRRALRRIWRRIYRG